MRETSVEELMGQFKSIRECAEHYNYEGLFDEDFNYKHHFTFADGSRVEVCNQKIEDDTWVWWNEWKIRTFTDDELDRLDDLKDDLDDVDWTYPISWER